MRRHFLLLLFAVLLLSEMFGWKLGVWQGFSIKNAFLYGFFLLILVERLAPGASKDPLLTKIHWPFMGLILVGGISWAFTDLRTHVPNYSSEDRLIALKSMLVDFYLFFLVYYFGFLVVVGYFPTIAETNVIGKINIAYLLALSEFVMAWVLVFLYVRRAGLFDKLTDAILKRVKGASE